MDFEDELCMNLEYCRRSTLNLVFICWFIIKYCLWGLRLLHLSEEAFLSEAYEGMMHLKEWRLWRMKHMKVTSIAEHFELVCRLLKVTSE